MQGYQRIVGVPGLSNVGIVKSGPAGFIRPTQIYRSAQPSDYQLLGNIATILDLREFVGDDAETVQALGIRYINWPLTVFSDIEPDEFDKLMAIIAMPEYWPLLIHCTAGVDRTGTVCAAYRISQDKWSLNEALEEMEQYGAHEIIDADLRDCLQRYAQKQNGR